jgi:O-antigen/teichoic acid export membrane protein
MSSATMPTTSTTPATSAARREVLAWIADEVGARRMWKLTIFSTLGLLLVVGLLGMLVSIYLSGSASLDDIGLPIGVVALLLPIVGIGAVRGALGVRALRSHPLLIALEAPARVYH